MSWKISRVCFGAFIFVSTIISTKILFDTFDGDGSANIIVLTISPPLKSFSEEDLSCLAKAVYFEARDQSREGAAAVAEVVLHRVESPDFPDTICGVVTEGGERLYRCQFSFFCDGKSDIPQHKPSWEKAKRLAKKCSRGECRGVVANAVFYYNPAIGSPCWGKATSLIKTIGAHRFLGPIPWPEMKKLCLT